MCNTYKYNIAFLYKFESCFFDALSTTTAPTTATTATTTTTTPPSSTPTTACTTTTLSGTYPPFSCPADDTVFRTVALSDNCHMTYRVFKTAKSQTNAKASCASEGGFLSRVTTTAKMNMLLALTSCLAYSADDYYVDGSNAQSGPTWGSWIMSNNESVPMSNDFWMAGGPNNSDKTNLCLRMNAAAGHKFNDCKCTDMYFFICEK